MTLSIIVPCFNEIRTIESVVNILFEADLGDVKREVIIVEDCSTDGTKDVLKKLESRYPIKVIYNEKNLGKGGSVRKGIAQSTGDVVVVHDSDLEYDPNDFKRMLRPFFLKQVKFVNGTRFIGNEPHRLSYFSHRIANLFFTYLSNFFSKYSFTDVLSCYKMLDGEVFRDIIKEMNQNGFAFEVELVACAARRKLKACEVGISYYGRTIEEGKKIRFSDSFAIAREIIRSSLRH